MNDVERHNYLLAIDKSKLAVQYLYVDMRGKDARATHESEFQLLKILDDLKSFIENYKEVTT